MNAPVAAPQAAPWPTGVSQEVRRRQLSEIPETRMAVFILINLGVHDALINRMRTELLHSKSAPSALADSSAGWSF